MDAAPKPRVLVVEDEDSMRSLLCRVVEADYRPIPAASAEEAFARIAEQPVDAAIVDLVIPGTNGIAILEEVLRRTKRWDMPAVIVTCHREFEIPMRLVYGRRYPVLRHYVGLGHDSWGLFYLMFKFDPLFHDARHEMLENFGVVTAAQCKKFRQ